MKKTTLYLLFLCLVGLLPTNKALAQDLFNCELAIALSATGTCGEPTGTITIDITGGFGHSYTIHWSNQYTRNAAGTVVTSHDSYTVKRLPAARYTVVVIDNYSKCRVLEQVDVVPNYAQGGIAVKGKPASCNGYGAIDVAIDGNEPTYYVELSGTMNASYIANSNNFSIFKLTPGDYEVTIGQGPCTQTFEVTVADASGCSFSGSTKVKTSDSGATITDFTTNQLISKDKVTLHQNYPNPFNGQTTIRFELPQSTEAIITIQDHYGRIISKNSQTYTKGLNEFIVNGMDLNPGMYFYTISTEEFRETKRMLVQ